MAPITADTAEQTTVVVLKSIDSAFGAGESALNLGAAVGAVVEGDAEAAASLALDLALTTREQVSSVATLATGTGAVISETQDCEGGGSATVSIDTGSLSEVEFTNALQEGSIPAGTQITTQFVNCAQSGEAAINGSVTVTIQQLALEGEPGVDPLTMEFSAAFDGLTVGANRIDGDISVLLVSNAGTTDAVISGDRLEVTAGGETVTLLDYRVTAVEDTAAVQETFYFLLALSDLAQLRVETLEALRTNAFAENPISGVLRIRGADNASITITALDEVTVQLEVDSDGDGSVDATIVTTWAELDA
jgi:hypothetical protein